MFISYKKWKEQEKAQLPASEKVQCFNCGGGGWLLWGDMTDSEQNKYLTFTRYLEVAIQEVTALAQWRGKDPIEQAIEFGLGPHQYHPEGKIHYLDLSIATEEMTA